MDALRKFLVSCFGLVLALGLSVLVMMKGWGLEPKNWWWIIGVGFFGQILAQVVIKLGMLSDDDIK